ncbi:hypothetical protein L596_010067 [Steinernema carpocapsae]|uniref:Uncharacterized protein n=1 Tax=Steinernema carpocapsae TaxID=34508 RepID=A0A4U5PHI1_STECR|nr:hypothetical protein L596_010067 [Steinernema carpocapsae]
MPVTGDDVFIEGVGKGIHFCGTRLKKSHQNYQIVIQPFNCILAEAPLGFYQQVQLLPHNLNFLQLQEIEPTISLNSPSSTPSEVKFLGEPCNFEASGHRLMYRKGSCLYADRDKIMSYHECEMDKDIHKISYGSHEGDLVVAYAPFLMDVQEFELRLLKTPYPETEKTLKLKNYEVIDINATDFLENEMVQVHDGGVYLAGSGCMDLPCALQKSDKLKEPLEIDTSAFFKKHYEHQSGNDMWIQIDTNKYVLLSHEGIQCHYIHKDEDLNGAYLDLLPPKAEVEEPEPEIEEVVPTEEQRIKRKNAATSVSASLIAFSLATLVAWCYL